MDDGSPELSVGFVIDTGDSFSSLERLYDQLDSGTVEVLKLVAQVEKATGGMMKVEPAIANIKSFANAATRADQDIIRSRSQVEKSGEALIRSIQKQADSFGKTRSEIRGMKADAAALAAEQQGLTELAQRIRTAETALYDQEFAAARKASQEAEAAAEIKLRAAAEASAAAEAEAKAVKDAADAYRLFEAVAKQRMNDYRQQQSQQAAAAAEAEAKATEQLAAEHERLAAMVRESHDAQMADAAAAERLREATDPLYAATKRLNAEIAESTRLYQVGATAPDEYARQQTVLAQRLKSTTDQHNAMAVAGTKNAFAMQQFAIQIPDVVQGLLSGQKPFQIFIQQGGQVAQIAMMAEGGIKGFAIQLAGLAVAAAPVIVILGTVAGAAFAAFKQFQSQVKDSGDLTRYRNELGLTHKEMLQLSDGVDKAGGKINELTNVTVTAGDVMAGLWKTIADGANVDGAWDSFKSGAADAFGVVIDAWNATSAGITAGIYGTANAAKVIWNNFATSVGDAFYSAVNFAIDAMNKLAQAGASVLNGIIDAANKVPGVSIGHADPAKIQPVDNPYKGMAGQDAANAAAKAISDGYTKAYEDAKKADAAFWKQVGDNAKQSAKDRMKAEADAIKANRTPKKANDHGLSNALDQVDAQIKGQWSLAAAYQVSDAAAMKAEALQKAEEQAIRHKGEAGIFYEKELALAVAQAAAEGAKHIADLNAQTAAQTAVNDAVAAGILPASQMGQALELANEKRRLSAALAIAEENKQADQVARLQAEIANLGKAQADSNAEAGRAQVLAETANGADQLAQLRLEASLIGATNEVRAVAIAQLQAEQFLRDHPGASAAEAQKYIEQQKEIALQAAQNSDAQDNYNTSLSATADLLAQIDDNSRGVANVLSNAFGNVGDGIGQAITALTTYGATQAKIEEERKAAILAAGTGPSSYAAIAQAEVMAAKKSEAARTEATGQAIDGIKSLFSEHSKAYKIMQGVEEAYSAFQAAETIASIARDILKTTSSVANSAVRTTANEAEGASKIFAELGPWAFPVVAAMVAVIAALGFSGGGGGSNVTAPPSSDDVQKAAGTGTVLGSPLDKSASIANSLDLVAKNTSGNLQYSNEMLSSLKSIDASIGAMAATVAKQINVSGSLFDTSKLNLGSSGSAGFLGLFSSSTTRSLYDAGINLAATTVGNIVANGIAGQTYQIVEQVKKKSGFLGIGGGTKTSYSTTTGSLPADVAASIQSVIGALENGIVTAAGSIGIDGAKAMLDNFKVSIGKVSFNGLDAQGIEDQLNAIFSSVGDQMVGAVIPSISKFQKVGEGLFETLERVASTVVAVDAEFQKLGRTSTTMGIDVDMGVADMFDSVSDFTSAADAYFSTYYSTAEQTAAQTKEMQQVFASLNLAMPDTLAGFRQLVDAQDLTTAAGQSAYATLLKIAPAFADLQQALNGAKSAADAMSERQDLLNQLWQLQGDTASIRAAQLASLDPSNRALQEQIYAIQDAQDAAKAAQDLADAWTSVGDSIMDEVKRIRGLNDTASGGSFASLMGQFNAATAAARGGDQDAAKSLPQLSQDLLNAASLVATSRQELDRIQAQTAASLEATYAAIMAAQGGASAATTSGIASSPAVVSIDTLTTSQPATAPAPANDDIIAELQALRSEVAQLRSDNNSGHAATAGNTGAIKKALDNVTAASGGDAISTQAAA